jgi:uncharacterized membrane protein
MGLAMGLALLFLAGLMVNAWIVRRVFGFGERLLEKIPLVKSIYGALRDFFRYFAVAEERKDLKTVALVSVGNAKPIGSVMRGEVGDLRPACKDRIPWRFICL